ncbi:zinc-binding dehydrogenase [Pedobacter steynii]|uniref:zinc-binding dehydrogenase n=1 Tax=Pedobacter steynii TaxID=430522 RepID=UPI0009427BC6|nr:zinc-binding dehydrogenase [Pedobacter steynii]NQX43127.1 zinc-binding dehydrogenase [Pedobacter steynii]
MKRYRLILKEKGVGVIIDAVGDSTRCDGPLAERHHITKLTEIGHVKPIIDSIYPIEEVKNAHQRIEDAK